MRFVRRWLQRRRQWHGPHHRRVHEVAGSLPSAAMVGHYGVSSAFWERVFRTGRRV